MDSGTFGELFLMMGDTLSVATQQQRQQLRRQLRQQRRALGPQKQALAARTLCLSLQKNPRIQQAKHIAAYVASDGEINPLRFIRWAQRHGKTLWLPVVTPTHSLHRGGLHFVKAPALHARRGWRRNAYGIAEPISRQSRSAKTLDIVLMPLVGFDTQGNRLGMGGGYYDRLLAKLSQSPRRPRTMGLAHACQHVASLPKASWDRAVDALIVV